MDTQTWAEDIAVARTRLQAHLRPTPLVRSECLSRAIGRDVYLKLESQQPVGAFKVRPALNSMLSDLEGCRSRGVVTNSSGNFAQAVAFAASTLGIDASIVMMEGASQFKRDRTRSFGGTVVLCENTFESRSQTTDRIQAETGRILLHPFDSRESIAGNGTLGLEILNQLKGEFTLFVPVSGGGLIAGSALAIKATRPACRIYGVQACANPAMKRSLQAGRPVSTTPAASIADALSVPKPGRNTFPIIRRLVQDVLLISEEHMRSAIRTLAVEQKLVVEAGGAVSVAAALRHPDRLRNEPVVCVISGGNIDPIEFRQLLRGRS